MKIFWIISQILVIALLSFLILVIFGLIMFSMGNIIAVSDVSLGQAFKNEGLLIALQIIVFIVVLFYVLTYTFIGYAVRDRERFSKWLIVLLSLNCMLMVIRTVFVPMISQRYSIWMDHGYSEPSYSHHPFIFISGVLAICVIILLKRQHADYIIHPLLSKRTFYIVCVSVLMVNAVIWIFISYEPEPLFG
ncbi:MAG: hypothetical protein ACO1N9_05655 [Flavobacterium sp.]